VNGLQAGIRLIYAAVYLLQAVKSKNVAHT
jgi:hypothetical protein